jgi:hypothetical protein
MLDLTNSTPAFTQPDRIQASVQARSPDSRLFESMFLAGFECSTQQLEDGRRLDLIASTRHDEFAERDYARLRQQGIRAARDGANWAHCEVRRGVYDFSRVATLLQAANNARIQVVWDLLHFGWPADVDVFSSKFPDRFARYARAFAVFLKSHTDSRVMITPINEMSFMAWAGGDMRLMNPFESARGVELKSQFVRATIEAMEAIWDVTRDARFLQPEPLIHIHPDPNHPKTWRRIDSDILLQYQAWDMLCGNVWPSLGGHPKYLDIIGVNFYPDNQFMLDGTTVYRSDPRYKPFARMLLDAWHRYRRPMLISETGCEGEERAGWLRYVGREAIAAMNAGCELHGITLYPILNHPGWSDERHCQNGLWDYADEHGERLIYTPLADALRELEPALEDSRAKVMLQTNELHSAPDVRSVPDVRSAPDSCYDQAV